MYLVSCLRATTSNDGEVTPGKPNQALCNGQVGFRPLHWTGEDGCKALFDYHEVGEERFSPVEWRCDVNEDESEGR